MQTNDIHSECEKINVDLSREIKALECQIEMNLEQKEVITSFCSCKFEQQINEKNEKVFKI